MYFYNLSRIFTSEVVNFSLGPPKINNLTSCNFAEVNSSLFLFPY